MKINLLCVFTKKKDFQHFDQYPLTMFYGYNKLIHEQEYSVNRLEAFNKNLLWFFWRPFELFFYLYTGVGFALGQMLANLSFINQHDIVLGMNDTSGIPLALLKKIGLVRPKIIFISAGLINNLEAHKKSLTFLFYKWFLPSADLILAWSPLERDMYKNLLGARSEWIPLEADVNFYKPDFGAQTENYIFSIGRDIGRDLQTFFAACKKLPNIPVKVIAGKLELEGLKVPDNVEIISGFLSYDALKDLYIKARLAVVPVKEISRISGQTALLEAMAMGKAVIAAKTKSFESAYPNLENRKHLLWYEPGNAEDLKNKILEVYDNPEFLNALGHGGLTFAESLPRNWFYDELKKYLKKITIDTQKSNA